MLTYEEFENLLKSIGLSDSKEQEALLALFATLAASELSEDQAKHVLEIFSLEGLQQLKNTPENVLNAEWKKFDYGNVKIGDFVRVRHGVYKDSETGVRHEGRIGVLVSMSNYRCRVRYIGLHAGTIIVHPMQNLESMKRVR